MDEILTAQSEGTYELPAPVSRKDRILATMCGATGVEIFEPIANNEKYLASILGVYSGALPEPVTREDKFLGYWAGLDVELPEPVARIDLYLAKICGVEVTLPAVPISRYEKYLAYIGENMSTEYPFRIAVTSMPTKIVYQPGEVIDYTGLVVKAFNLDRSIWENESYPGGVIPHIELILPESYA